MGSYGPILSNFETLKEQVDGRFTKNIGKFL